MRRRGAESTFACVVAAAALWLCACRSDTAPNVFVTAKLGAAELQGQVFALRVSVAGGRSSAVREFRRDDATSLQFPTTFSFSISKEYGDTVDVTIQGMDAVGRAVAQAELKALRLRAGTTVQQEIFLNCFGKCPTPLADAGVGVDAVEPVPNMANCGNSRLDPGETCDVGFSAGLPGACPANECNDGLACTRDQKLGSGCQVRCVHQEILTLAPGDGCCPAGGDHTMDEDCSATCGDGVVDPLEACDKAISQDSPGACPTKAVCNDGNECTVDVLISADTCAARCTRQLITLPLTGDRCCPATATQATDPDCPIVCGDGLVEAGETCDTAIPAGKSGACPKTCNDDKACTTDILVGAGCQVTCDHGALASAGTSDGCCPPNTSALADPDCASACGNGVVEASETCDKAIAGGQAGACPSTCTTFGCQVVALKGTPETCTATCETMGVAACAVTAKDGCCAAGCNATTDVDCVSTCGNGVVDGAETCDTALLAPSMGACPVTCADNDPCTEDRWDSKGSCLDKCVHRPVTAFKSGDICCPTGANRSVDADCASTCGNGVVEGKETCDRGIAEGKSGACPTTCVPTRACETVKLAGNVADCTAVCAATPVLACTPGDGCCPVSCSANRDADCPVVCGNGELEAGEACDKGITAGHPGACASTCEAKESCVTSAATGSVDNCSRRCTPYRNRACAGGDGCCPVGCSFGTDQDCAPICGNAVVEDGETCDPPSSCPTSCSPDADLCTAAKLEGDPSSCNARCIQDPILECGTMADQCCPSGCTQPASDPDCKPPKPAPANMSPAL